MQAIEPKFIRAGDTAVWQKVVDGYSPADGWVLQYVLLNGTSRHIIDASVVDGVFEVRVAAAVTAPWSAGRYDWVARVNRGGEVYTVDSDVVEVLPDLTTAADLRSHAEKVLASIEAVIEKRATLDQEEYTINGRSLTRTPLPELIKLRDIYRRDVRNLRGDKRGRKLLVRF